ncbi:hypothetical protein NDU88_003729 [Pleurodeles waltl]|uniref:Uncharacterized protein n=1 Tax=Pleurodeles waltl TaxID=8319 RepID=A0AAV7UZA2_PLEWA|nr:hypothetical protein NDU88_003729 [Pleurodeles waltl]
METKGGVTRSRDSKDFFEEKQLVTLRPNTRWRAIAEHANLLRLMPRTDVHWKSFRVTRPRDSSSFVSIAHGRRLHLRLFFFRYRVRTCSFLLRVSGRKDSQNFGKLRRYCLVPVSG